MVWSGHTQCKRLATRDADVGVKVDEVGVRESRWERSGAKDKTGDVCILPILPTADVQAMLISLVPGDSLHTPT